ncbi:hypothetical protein CIB48_g7059 [Xylaria polymorpha]|nr:hypothetical protein CIB48_g7059 [Xylaria polymorpha]
MQDTDELASDWGNIRRPSKQQYSLTLLLTRAVWLRWWPGYVESINIDSEAQHFYGNWEKDEAAGLVATPLAAAEYCEITERHDGDGPQNFCRQQQAYGLISPLLKKRLTPGQRTEVYCCTRRKVALHGAVVPPATYAAFSLGCRYTAHSAAHDLVCNWASAKSAADRSRRRGNVLIDYIDPAQRPTTQNALPLLPLPLGTYLPTYLLLYLS